MASLFSRSQMFRQAWSSARVLRTSHPLQRFQLQQLRRLSDQTRRYIDETLQRSPVVLFMKGTPDVPQCGFSRVSIKILELQGVDRTKFEPVNVLENDELRQGIKEYSKWPTIPQLYVNKEFVGGCDILISMHQSGELADLLEKEEVLVPLEEQPPADGVKA